VMTRLLANNTTSRSSPRMTLRRYPLGAVSRQMAHSRESRNGGAEKDKTANQRMGATKSTT
jgi:hypothetical protein